MILHVKQLFIHCSLKISFTVSYIHIFYNKLDEVLQFAFGTDFLKTDNSTTSLQISLHL